MGRRPGATWGMLEGPRHPLRDWHRGPPAHHRWSVVTDGAGSGEPDSRAAGMGTRMGWGAPHLGPRLSILWRGQLQALVAQPLSVRSLGCASPVAVQRFICVSENHAKVDSLNK